MPNVSHLLAVAALTSGPSADNSLEFVRRAQGLIEPYTWSEVIRIENPGVPSRYPRVVNALVFQLDSVLWFYTPIDGTQSLSLYRGRAEADKLNLGPLLAAIDAGFTRWEELPRAPSESRRNARLPNGCFIESVAIFFDRLAQGAQMEDPRLLSYYVAFPAGVRGHTVFQFKSGGRVQVIDPDRPNSPMRMRDVDENDPKSVAGRIRSDIASARHLPLIGSPGRAPERYISIVSTRSNIRYGQVSFSQTEVPGIHPPLKPST